jgi:hypothetical protein
VTLKIIYPQAEMLLAQQNDPGRDPLAEQGGVGAADHSDPEGAAEQPGRVVDRGPDSGLGRGTPPMIASVAGGQPPLTASFLDSYVGGSPTRPVSKYWCRASSFDRGPLVVGARLEVR